MYVVALGALWSLWRRRTALSLPLASTWMAGAAWMGFGIWHLLDAVLSHWLLGIHRVRSDTENPLAWDILWFVVFGVLPLAGGLLLRRRHRDGGGGPGGGRGAGSTTVAVLAAATLSSGLLAAMPSDVAGQSVVVFAPGVSGRSAFDALARLDARIRWVDRSGSVWAVQMDRAHAAQLYRDGALWVSGDSAGWGCVSWSVGVRAPLAPTRGVGT